MIRFYETPDIFENEVLIQVQCDYLKDCFKTPFRVKTKQIDELKHRLTKIVLFRMCENMINQRINNYNHAEIVNPHTFETLMIAKEKINYHQTANLDIFINVLKMHVLPAFYAAMPKIDSRYFENFNKKVNDIEKYINDEKH